MSASSSGHLGGAGGPEIGNADRLHRSRTTAGRFGSERLGTERGEVRRTTGEGGRHQRVASEDRRGDRDRIAVGGDVDVVREHGAIELHRETSHHVTTLVRLREHHEIGRVAAIDDRLHGRGHCGAGEVAAVVDAEHLARAMRSERTRDGVAVTGDPHADRTAERTRLGDQFERRRSGRTIRNLSEDPNVVDCHCSVPFSRPLTQMTLRPSRKATILPNASPSSSMTSPAARASA